MSRQWHGWEFTDTEYDRLFKFFSPETVEADMRARGHDVRCEDEATLRATAEILLDWEAREHEGKAVS